jgi:hypothetical protein
VIEPIKNPIEKIILPTINISKISNIGNVPTNFESAYSA